MERVEVLKTFRRFWPDGEVNYVRFLQEDGSQGKLVPIFRLESGKGDWLTLAGIQIEISRTKALLSKDAREKDLGVK